MTRKTRLQLRTEARVELLEPTPARWSDEQLNRYLNLGQEDLAGVGQTRVRAAVAVSAGEGSVSAPATILVIENVWWESGGCRWRVRWAYQPFEPNPGSRGTPRIAWREEETVRFWPSASASGSLLFKGRRRPAAMAADDSTHDLPDFELVNEALIAFAVWQAYLSDFDPQRDIWGPKYGQLKGQFELLELQRNPQRGVMGNVYEEDEPGAAGWWDYRPGG